jgi:hypothetical protein
MGADRNLKPRRLNMSDTDTNTTPKTPSHTVYHVRDSKGGGKGFWTRIGSAWSHADSKGFNVQLDGRITLRVATEQK